MKKLFLLFFAFFLINSVFSQGTNLPNGGLESWSHLGTAPNDYDQPDSGFFMTLNELADVPPATGGPGPVTVYKDASAHTGNFAAKLVSKQFTGIDIFIPGMLGTTTLDMIQSTIHLGRPCSMCNPMPTGLRAFVKYEPVNGDSGLIIVLLSKYDVTHHKRDTISFGKNVIKNGITAYTQIDVPLLHNYPDSLATPDSITILFVASAGVNFQNIYVNHGSPGSTMFVDDISLLYPLGITEGVMPEVVVKSYPNPALKNITFESDKIIKEGKFEIFNNQARQISTFVQSGKTTQLNVSSFCEGVYFYRLMSGTRIIASGSFAVRK